MQDLNALRFILRHGAIGAVIIALILAAGATWLSWALVGWGAPVVGVVVAPLAWLFLKSYVELVSIIFQTVN